MNAAVQPIQATVPNGVCFLSGRIAGKRAIKTAAGRQFLTLIKLPAPDEFTSPQTVEVRSTQPLGDVGADVRCKVRIGGFARSYDSKPDPETGEVHAVRTADIRLEVIEG